MKISSVLIGTLVSLASAHSDSQDGPAMPQLVGARKFLSEMKSKKAFLEPLEAPHHNHKSRAHEHGVNQMQERQNQNVDGQCGGKFGSCAPGICCSAAGYCGTGIDYCAAPDCQYQYGPACDANTKPGGASTASIARPALGNIEYGGEGIYDCNVLGDIALTFDDGPGPYTADLLDKLKKYGAKATFFISGNNNGKGPMDTTPEWSSVVKRMVAEGHQVASHTWSHQNLDEVDAATFQNQIIYNEMAFRNILGYFPTYMRPPYSACQTAACMSTLKTMGYHVTYFDLDTQGYLNDDAKQIQKSKDIWDQTINPSNPTKDNYLQIEHDIHYQTVYNLTDYILASMTKKGYKAVTLGECLGDPSTNWYRSAGGAGATMPATPSSTSAPAKTSSTSAPTSTAKQAISKDGSCSAKVTCKGSTFGDCCSSHGYCGSTADYCGTGCNAVSGSCGTKPAASGVKVVTSASTSSTTTAAKPTATTLKVTQDGTCGTNADKGGATGNTCLGAAFGNCCSSHGWCGSSADYCGTGCQKGAGNCS